MFNKSLSLFVTTLFCSMILVTNVRADANDNLFDAIDRNDLKGVAVAIKQGADVNATDVIARRPLHKAAAAGYITIVKLLIKNGSKLNSKDETGKTPLHWAAEMGYLNITKLLIEKGADVESKDNDHSTPLHWAANEGHVDIINYLLDHSANVNSQEVDGSTPLRWAAEVGHTKAVRLLIKRGANVNAKIRNGMTPLHWAASGNVIAVVKILVENGANVNAQDEKKQTPLHIAGNASNSPIYRYLLTQGADDTITDIHGNRPKIGTSYKANPAAIKIPEANNPIADVNLINAVKNGNYKKVTELIESGRNINAKDQNGWTPLHYAIDRFDTGMILILLRNGADVNAKTPRNLLTPLHMAALSDQSYVVKLLIKKRANLYARDKNGYTPLGVANSNEVKAIIIRARKHLARRYKRKRKSRSSQSKIRIIRP